MLSAVFVATKGWHLTPHSPILLLSILDEIGRGRITDNKIVLNVELVSAFYDYCEGLPLPPG